MNLMMWRLSKIREEPTLKRGFSVFLKSILAIVGTAAILAISGILVVYPAELTLTISIPDLPAPPGCVVIIPPGKAWNCIAVVGMPLTFTVQATITATGPQAPSALDVTLSASALPPNVSFPMATAKNTVSQTFSFTPIAAQNGNIFPMEFTATSAGLSVSMIVQILVVGPLVPVAPATPLPPAPPMPPALALPARPAGTSSPPNCLNFPPSPLLFICSKLLLK